MVQDFYATSIAARPVYADKHLLVTRTDNPFGLRFAGEIDLTNSDAVAQSLQVALAYAGDPHLDLSRLSFCDIGGIRALVDAAGELRDGRRLLLHGLPANLQTVLRATGWADMPALVLCSCGGDAL